MKSFELQFTHAGSACVPAIGTWCCSKHPSPVQSRGGHEVVIAQRHPARTIHGPRILGARVHAAFQTMGHLGLGLFGPQTRPNEIPPTCHCSRKAGFLHTLYPAGASQAAGPVVRPGEPSASLPDLT